MKSLFTILIMSVVVSFTFSQAPTKFSFQAVLRDPSNSLVKNTTVGMQISILKGSETGLKLYVEKHTTQTNAKGLVTIEIGGGTAVSGNFLSIDWSEGSYFIKTETDFAGGTNYILSGVSPILSTPYALLAKNVESITVADPIQGNGSINNPISIGEGTIQSKHIENQTIKPEDISLDGVSSGEILVLKWVPGFGQWGFHPEAEYQPGNGIQINPAASDPYGAKVVQITTNGASENDVLSFKSGQWRAEPIPAAGISGSGSNSLLPIFNSSTSITNSVIQQSSSGNIGIDINPTSHKLAVDGDIRVIGSVFLGSAESFRDAGSYQIESDGTLLTKNADYLGTSAFKWSAVWATNGVIQTSDEKMKKDITNMSDGIDKVKKLRPVTYSWKDPQPGDKSTIGFLAQNLLEVVPESVVTEELVRNEDGTSHLVPVSTLGVKYNVLIPVLTKAIQEQQDMIETLMQKSKQQQDMIDALIKKVDAADKH